MADPASPEADRAMVGPTIDTGGEHDVEKDVTASPTETFPENGSSPAHDGGCCGRARSCSCCREAWDYGGVPEARGYALLAMGRGVAVMSNGASSSFEEPSGPFRGTNDPNVKCQNRRETIGGGLTRSV